MQGAGKSVGMTYFLLSDYQNGRRIYANYDLMFPKIKNNPYLPTKVTLADFIETLYSLDHPDVQPKIAGDQYPKSIGLDEVHTMWNAYRYNKGDSLDMGFFVDQNRKINADIYYTSQHPEQIPIQLRRVTTDICYCESIPPTETKNPIGFRYMFTNRFSSEIHEIKIPITELWDVFPLYRTYQRISPEVTKNEVA